MFAKKKPSDSMDEAPKFAGSPTLPSSGQTPGATPTNVNGTVAAGTPTYNSVDNKFANSSYGTQPAAYQQAVYPTTPYPPVTVAQNQSPGIGATNPPPASHAASGGLVDHSAALPAYGAANPTTVTYGNSASTTVQPQQGPYNPNYGSGSGVTTSPAYAAAAPSSPVSNGMPPMAPPTTAAPPTMPQQDYRMADSRGAASAPVQNSAAPADGNSVLGDRYANVNASGWPADRYSNPADNPTGPAPVTNASPPAGAAGTDRYNMTPNNYQSPAPTNSGLSSPYGATSDVVAPPTTNNGSSAIPARSSTPYLPGGTSSFAPRSNTLRPGSTDTPQAEPSRVMPASYETATGAMTPAASNANAAESYGTYQGAPAQPAGGNSNASAAQPGLYNGHSW